MAQRLHDVQPFEVSLVKRGANRRRFLLAKSGEVEFDETIAKVLDEPAENEREWLDAVEKAGGDEDVVNVAAAVARSWESLPAEIRKAIRPLMFGLESEPKAAPKPAEAVAKQNTPRRSAAESLAEVTKIVDGIRHGEQQAKDAGALERLEKSAEELRMQNPRLTKAQAFAKAVKANPEDARAYSRHQERGWGYDPEETIRKAESVQAVLDRAAQPFLDADPSLSREQAVIKALNADPTLYERTRP